MNEAKRAAYDAYLISDEWKAKRQEAFRVYGRACQACLATKRLHVHHVTYARFEQEHIMDLRVLCEPCHALVHNEHRARGGSAAGVSLRVVTDQVIQNKPISEPKKKRKRKRRRKHETAPGPSRSPELDEARALAAAHRARGLSKADALRATAAEQNRLGLGPTARLAHRPTPGYLNGR